MFNKPNRFATLLRRKRDGPTVVFAGDDEKSRDPWQDRFRTAGLRGMNDAKVRAACRAFDSVSHRQGTEQQWTRAVVAATAIAAATAAATTTAVRDEK